MTNNRLVTGNVYDFCSQLQLVRVVYSHQVAKDVQLRSEKAAHLHALIIGEEPCKWGRMWWNNCESFLALLLRNLV